MKHVHRRWATTVLALTLLLLSASIPPASAHTGFEASNPPAGAILDEGVTVIAVTFTGEASPAGDGFVVLDPAGATRLPDEVSSKDNITWTLRFAEPLAGGEVGVRWKVAAPDAHPIEGSFSFRVTEPATPTPTESSPTVADPALRPQLADSVEDLESFLDTGGDGAAGAAVFGFIARTAILLGAVITIGGAVFATFVLRGERSDVTAVLFSIRRGGVLVMAGALLDAAVQTVSLASRWSGLWSPGALADALWSSFGIAVLIRLVGGWLITSGTTLETISASARSDSIISVNQLASVGAGPKPLRRMGPTGAPLTEPFVFDDDEKWDVRAARVAIIGLALLTVSFLFDGHTASEDPRWLHALANTVHVIAAATWAGGVIRLSIVMARRRRRGVDPQALQLAARFSVVATGALVAAGVAGTALSIVILDSVSQLWSTPWGQLLIVKVLLVCAAGVGGAYNHHVVVPELERARSNRTVVEVFRLVVAFEAVVLVGVTIVTALLIVAPAT